MEFLVLPWYIIADSLSIRYLEKKKNKHRDEREVKILVHRYVGTNLFTRNFRFTILSSTYYKCAE